MPKVASVSFAFRVKDKATPYLQRKEAEILNKVSRRLELAAEFLVLKMQQHAEPSPNYSLKELRDMGHPYAKRHYEEGGEGWSPTAGTPAGIHTPWWEVNIQSGQLKRDIGRSALSIIPGGFEIRAGVPDSSPASPYARHVLYGTRTMVPRNFIGNSTSESVDLLRGIMMRGA